MEITMSGPEAITALACALYAMYRAGRLAVLTLIELTQP